MSRLLKTRLLTLLCFFPACFATTLAQYNVIAYPAGGYDITAGEPYTITWTNPSSGTVTINLYKSQQDLSDPLVLANDVSASDEAATIAISPSSVDSSSQYEFEIVDNTDTHNIAFSSHTFYVKPASDVTSSASTTSALSAPNASSTFSSIFTSSTSSTTATNASLSSHMTLASSSSQPVSPSTSTRTSSRTSKVSASQTAVASSPTDGSGSGSSSGLSTGAKAGIGVGAALVVVSLLLLAYWFGRRHNRKSSNRGVSASRHEAELDAEGNARHEIYGQNTGHELEGEKTSGIVSRAGDNETRRPNTTERAELGANQRQRSELDGNARQKT